MSNVIPFPVKTKQRIRVPYRKESQADMIFEQIKDANLKDFFVMGWDDEDCHYVNSTNMKRSEILWLLEVSKNRVMKRDDD